MGFLVILFNMEMEILFPFCVRAAAGIMCFFMGKPPFG